MAHVNVFGADGATISRVALSPDGTVVFEGGTSPKVLAMLQQVRGFRGQVYTPADGLPYLEALQVQFSGSRVRATGILDA